jgi:hypothetical protein
LFTREGSGLTKVTRQDKRWYSKENKMNEQELGDGCTQHMRKTSFQLAALLITAKCGEASGTYTNAYIERDVKVATTLHCS